MLLGLKRRLFRQWPRQHQAGSHRDSTWTSTGLKVTIAGCELLPPFGPWAEAEAGLGPLGSSSLLALIFLLYIFSKIRITAKMMMTTTTMAATMAPELLYRKSSSLVTFNEKKVVPPKGVAVVISIRVWVFISLNSRSSSWSGSSSETDPPRRPSYR